MPKPNYERIALEAEDRAHAPLYPPSHHEQDDTSILKGSIVRPSVYYGEGPFDPPSSEEEDETLLDKDEPLTLESEEMGPFADRDGLVVGGQKRRPSSLRCLVIALITLVVLSGIIGILAAHTYSGKSYHVSTGIRRITMDHVFNGTFSADRASLHWVPEAGDGVFSISQDGYIKLVDLKTNKTTNLVATMDVKDEHGRPLSFGSEWQLSADMKYILVKAHQKKQWRWSSFGNYYVHNLETKFTHPIIPPTVPPTTAYATWSPTGEAIAYVTGNDLYLLTSPDPSTSPIRITSSGNASLFHGVPDWVYEEEIFSAPYALWFSPDSSKLAFLTFDETLVPEFTFPIYNPTENSNTVVPYTSTVTMKYPKPGYNNPLVGVYVFDIDAYLQDDDVVKTGFPAENATTELGWEGRHPVDDGILLEVAWLGDSTLLVKEVNRHADNGSVVLFDFNDTPATGAKAQGAVVRKLGRNGEEGDDGWIDSSQNVYPLANSADAYLDIVPTPDGFNHIALFSPANSSTPRFLTSGKWEVTGGIQAVDIENSIVYFQAANPSSIERHIYSVSIPTTDEEAVTPLTALTTVDALDPSVYQAQFSPNAGFYLLSYQGPGIPWQSVVQVNNTEFQYTLTDNARLANATDEYEAPVVIHSTMDSDGFELNVKEIRPPRMDDTGRTKYPVLFRVYGGPSSQMVDLKFNRDWHDYLACGLQYIIVVVDGRGTGFKGRKLRNPVKDNLGFWETKDQINAARLWASKSYVDPKRIGIWGWSYGGFMSSKVVEADAGIHSLAMAVAPVTSWRLYDSIYTERYMNLPALNPGGYVNASISNVTGFHKVDYLLAHGSGDDNVHFANSAHLLDMFTQAQVRNFRFRMFTDSDHSINRRGGQREIYEYMTEFLMEKWGKGGRKRGW